MRGMILAAGRGERMGELTREQPKPLLKVGDRYLIEYAIGQLVDAGVTDIVINVSYLADLITKVIGNGERYGANIVYSHESERLETGGGILKALPFFGDDPFVVISSDVICDYALADLPRNPSGLAHLIVVPNPSFHPQGDFGIKQGLLSMFAKPAHTFANIGVYRKELFSSAMPGHFPLNQLLFPAIEQRQISGELYQGLWYNVGNPAELAMVNNSMVATP